MSLTAYRYSALDAQGITRTGMVRAEGEQDAYRRVAAAGLTPVKLREMAEAHPLFSFQRITASDIADLTRELNALVEAKIPLDRGLATIAEQEGKAALTAIVRDIAAQVEAGLPLTEAMVKHEAVFGEVYIETLRAAEKSGNLAAVMSHLAELLERQVESRRQLRRALTYPAIVLGVVAVAVTVIVVFVVPRFGETFAAHRVQLPGVTRALQAAGLSVKQYWWAYAAGLAAAAGGGVSTWRTPRGREVIERALPRVPYFGKLMVAITTAGFARVVSIGMASGLSLIESVEIAGRASGKVVFQGECARMGDALQRGEDLRSALKQATSLPGFAKRMLYAGQDSHELSTACNTVAKHYEREALHLTKNVNTVIEPILTLLLAGIVLLVALSVLLPMWQMVRLQH